MRASPYPLTEWAVKAMVKYRWGLRAAHKTLDAKGPLTMKLAITCYPTFGGSGAVATELAIGLADLGHEVHVVSSERPFRLNRWRKNSLFSTKLRRGLPPYSATNSMCFL